MSLDISYNKELSTRSIFLIIDNCPKLKKFIGKGLDKVKSLYVFSYLQDLEYLDVTDCKGFLDIPKFLKNKSNKKLKTLFLNGLYTQYTTNFVKDKTDLLRNLETFGFNLQSYDLIKSYSSIINKLGPNLRALNIGDNMFSSFFKKQLS